MSPPGRAAALGRTEGGAQIAGQEIKSQSTDRAGGPPGKVIARGTTRPRHEYRVSWRRTDRPHGRRSRLFQYLAAAERSVKRNAWWHSDVRLEQRTVGKWRPVGIDEDVT